MKELLALCIDQGTYALRKQINRELGRAAAYRRRLALPYDGSEAHHAYVNKLEEYIQLKLRLHRLQKACYYPFDIYAEKDDTQSILEQCQRLRREIKTARAQVGALAWGGLEPGLSGTCNLTEIREYDWALPERAQIDYLKPGSLFDHFLDQK